MKIETEKEIFFEKLNKNKTNKCENYENENHESFNKHLEKSIDELKEIEEIKYTSVFAEKKVGKRRTDFFDTLIDI